MLKNTAVNNPGTDGSWFKHEAYSMGGGFMAVNVLCRNSKSVGSERVKLLE